MAQKNINIGSGELVGDGESIRSAFDKINQNFVELYAGVGTAEANDLTQAVVWANVPDTNITQSSVTQHQAAISITESQISDLQNYLTSYTETNDLTSAVTWTNVPDINITQSSVTQHQAALTITQSQISDLTHYTDSDVDTHLNTSTAVAEQILSWDGADYSWISQEEVDILGSFSVTAPNAAFGSGGLDYNSTNGQFTYTPPDLSNFLSAETDTLQTVTTRGNTTTNEVELNGGVKTNIVQSTNGVHSIGFNEAQPLTIGSTGGVKIIGAAAGTVELGTETSGTVTIGSSSNNVDFSSGTTVDFTGTTVTGLNVTGDITGSVFGDDSTLLVDGVNNTIPKANIQDSTNWDTAFGWGDHSVAGYLTSETTTTLAINANILKYTDETGAETDIDLSLYLDDTNLARLTSGTLDGPSGIATFTRDDATTFTVDFSDLINTAEANDLTAAVVWADVPDANITESSVTQHQAALSITESQISDLSHYTNSDVDAHLNTSTASAGEVLQWSGTDYTWQTGSGTVIAPFAFGFVDDTANGSGTGISWSNWDVANSRLDFTFDSAQQNTDYAVITDSETFDDYFVGITNKTTTGFRAEFYDGSGSRTPSSFSPFTFVIYASTPTQTVLGTTQDYAFSSLTGLPTTLSGYGITDGYANSDVDAHLNTSTATSGQILSWTGSDYDWVADAGGIALTDLSIGTPAAASGSGSIAYDNSSGVFTYTPPDLSSYLTSYTETNDLTAAVTWANVPDANITESSVTQHEAALSITESQISDLQSYLTAESDPVYLAEKGQPNGVATLDGSGLVPSSQLPSYVDDVLSYANFAAFPVTGETGKIYVDQATNDIFRWDGVAVYIQINDAVSSADQATQLATSRDFSLTGDVTATAVGFNGTGDVALSTTVTESAVTQHQAALSITESQISDLGSYLTDLTGSSVGTLSDVDFNSVTLDASNGQDKVLAWDQTAQAFVPVDQTNTNTTTFGLAGNTGTHTFDMVSETLTFLGATNQIDIEVATNFISVNLASVVDADIKGSVFADDSSLLVNGVDGTLAYTAATPTDWNGTAPTTVGEAIDRLAALVKTLNGGTGA